MRFSRSPPMSTSLPLTYTFAMFALSQPQAASRSTHREAACGLVVIPPDPNASSRLRLRRLVELGTAHVRGAAVGKQHTAPAVGVGRGFPGKQRRAGALVEPARIDLVDDDERLVVARRDQLQAGEGFRST